MIIHKDCIKTTLGIWLVSGGLIFLLFYFVSCPFITYPLSAILFFLMGFTVFFFRVPNRTAVPGDKVITSVADGKIVVIEKVYEPEFLKRECMQVSVYMDFFNVHVNFWPMSGEVTYYKYHPGKYMLAFLPKASELNEHSSIAMKNDHGEILFKQLAGTFARRIVTYADSGASVIKGEQCGIIRFGSRIDMYLPLDAEIKVRMGECVSACETVIAEMK
ncbi:MAG: phosphatidylserine decarboxylase family protein [Bacteroidales bacterium]|nr:phosphatidylserine decarboxylase family protein [Bacteroidales bacterium]